ncbi:MAG: hypothetical protein CMQ20_07795 [Gammaproteobacteria bacterium]|jgi:crotonobetaine/carnitine-CoA ligase|nr:hypothetical protein [Gammaproteobacteria bacterium]|tara:strand:- start:9662 stop:11263 length:1602 start_codon:yes stop_codon:yes gene_type:complete
MTDNRTRLYNGEWILTSVLLDRAERFGSERAIMSHHGDLSWAEIVDRAARIGGFLLELGVKSGDRVATMLPSGIDYLGAWHGIMWCSAIDVPVNNEYKGLFLEHILRDSGAGVLIVDARWLERLQHIELAELKHIVVVGGSDVDLPPGLARHSFAHALGADPCPLTPRTETDLTYIIYTSGTTGPAKGVIHNNRSSLNYIQPFVEGLDLTDDDVCYSMFPLFHQMGRSACTLTAFWVGNPVVLRESFTVSGFWDDIRSSGASWMGYFGAVISFLWNQEAAPGDSDHNLTRAFGASAPRELITGWKERFGVNLFETYGSTEIGLGSGLGSGLPKLGTMGLPSRRVELQIVDENDMPVPANVVGEAVWRPREAYAIFQGYWNRPQETVNAWRNLWFHSGDAGLLDEDGYFIFKDRFKDSIRRRDENISSFAVEESVRVQPGILECAAYAAVSDVANTDQEVMIAVVPDAESKPDVEALFHVLCETMPRHAVPRYLRFVNELPKTPTQRVQKFKLREEGVTDDTFDREAMGIFPSR